MKRHLHRPHSPGLPRHSVRNVTPMRAILLIVCSLLPNWVSAAEPPRGRLLFLGIAYDEDPGRGLTVNDFDYAPDNFARLFREQSASLFSKVQVDTLKGAAATRAAVFKRLHALTTNATSEDLVFLYWGTHGGTIKQEWEANLPGNGKIQGSEIKAELQRLKCPAIVVISTCGSGGFIRPTPRKIELPDNVAAFCACRRRQSTNNELDVTLLEALAGFGDLNQDGQVTLQEAIHYVPRRHRKLIQDAEGPETEPVLGHAPGFSLDRPLAKASDQRVAAAHDGVWYGAQVLERKTGKSKVRYLGWDSTSRRGPFAFPDREMQDEALDLPGGFPPVEVKWNDSWYPATIVERRGDQFQIHYVGYPDSDNEAVPLNRIRYPFVGETLSLNAAPAKGSQKN